MGINSKAMFNLDSFKLIFNSKRLFIFDMDGVIYRFSEPIPFAADLIAKLRELGKQVLFLTNNSTKTRESFANKLKEMGIPAKPEEIQTSAHIAASALSELHPKGMGYVIGEEGLHEALKDYGLSIINEEIKDIEDVPKIPDDINVDFVVSGMDTKCTYNKLRTGMMFALKGAPYYATNDDANFPAPGTLWPGSGAIVAFLSTALLQPPRMVFGKPHPEGIEKILIHHGISKEEAVLVGDRLDTDILGGNRAGITTIFVETGINTRNDLTDENKEMHPSIVVSNLGDLLNILN